MMQHLFGGYHNGENNAYSKFLVNHFISMRYYGKCLETSLSGGYSNQEKSD